MTLKMKTFSMKSAFFRSRLNSFFHKKRTSKPNAPESLSGEKNFPIIFSIAPAVLRNIQQERRRIEFCYNPAARSTLFSLKANR